MGKIKQSTGNSSESGRSGSGDDSDFGRIRLIPDLSGEPRIYDLDLGMRLGFQRDRDVRQIIERNLGELADYGEIVRASTAVQTSWTRGLRQVPQTSEQFAALAANLNQGGRPGRGYLLNLDQAVLIAARSHAPLAAKVRRQVIAACNAYRAGLTRPELIAEPRQDLPPSLEDTKTLAALDRALRLLDQQGRILIRQGRIIERQQGQMDALARRLDRADVRADATDARLGRVETRAAAAEDRAAARAMAPASAPHTPGAMVFGPDDLLGRFLDGCTDPQPQGTTAARPLYLAWCEWCRAAGLVPGSETRFGRTMKAHGADFRKNSVMFYLGFTLRERAAWAPASVVQRDGGAA